MPLLRDDLVLVFKSAKGMPLAGRLAIVDRVTSLLRLLDASPKRSENNAHLVTELSAETYYRSEKESFRVLLRSPRLTRFVVLDVESVNDGGHHHQDDDDGDNPLQYQGPASSVTKYALADVVVARASDFWVNDHATSVVTHLGTLVERGDTVLGYDLETAVSGD